MKRMHLVLSGIFLLLSGWLHAQIKSQQECVYDGKFSASNIDMPATLYPDQKDQVVITVENIGTCNWRNNDVEMKVTIYRGPSGAKVQRDELIPSAPLYAPETGYRGTCRFMYTMEGPYYLGEYTLEFVLTYKGQKFGDLVRKSIKIVPKR